MIEPAIRASNDWKFFRSWILANFAGGLVATIMAVVLVGMFMFSRADIKALGLIIGLIWGALLGAAQWLVLRTRQPWAAAWILATAAGAALSVPLVISLSASRALGDVPEALAPYLLTLLLGATLGVCQWFVLCKRAGSGLWILASAFATVAATPAAILIGSLSPFNPLAWIAYGGVFLIPAAITGAALMWLLHPSRAESGRRAFLLHPAFSLALAGGVALVIGLLWMQLLANAPLAAGSGQSYVVFTPTPPPTLRTAAPNELVLSGHKDTVRAVAFAPDGRSVASASVDGTVRLWDALTGKNTRTLAVNTAVLSVAFAPDGRSVAAGLNGRDGQPTLNVWDIATGGELQSIVAHLRPVYGVAYSSDGQFLVTGSIDKTLKVWRVDNWQTRIIFSGHSDWIYAVAVAPDSATIASASWDHTVKLWRLNGQDARSLSGHTDRVMSVAFSPDGKLLASGGLDSQVKLWSVADGSEVRTLSGHHGAVNSVVFAPDGRTLASGSDDGTITFWDASNGDVKQTWQVHSGSVTAVAFSPDGRSMASGSVDATVRLRIINP